MSDRARVIALLVIWGLFALMAMTLLIVQGSDANFILLAILGLAAWIVTDYFMKIGEQSETEADADTAKAKRGSTDLLSLLDEDDIADLRARVKTRLMNTIDGGSDGELSALDQLLAEQQSKRR